MQYPVGSAPGWFIRRILIAKPLTYTADAQVLFTEVVRDEETQKM